MNAITPLLNIEIATGVPKNDGFCWCGHCHHVVKMSQHDVDRLETAYAGGLCLKIKCPRCNHHKVQLRFPQVPKAKPAPKRVDPERGHNLFLQMHAVCQ